MDEAALRQAIYAGEVHVLPASPASRALVAAARAEVCAAFALAEEAARTACRTMDPAEHFRRVTRARRAIAEGAPFAALCARVLDEAGFDPRAHAIDAPRLRAVASGGHRVAAARRAYTAHRDTWYANPQAQINWWIPLFDVAADESFAIFPRCFAQPVANDSGAFDYDAWKRAAGFANPAPDQAAPYPEALAPFDEEDAIVPACRAAEIVLFSAAHLHRTCAHDGGRTRFSVDFRAVHQADHARGLGAPNVDARCRGSALVDYARAPR